MLAVYRGSPKFPRPAEGVRRAKSHLRKEDADRNRKHESIDHAFVNRSLSHTPFLVQIDRQGKKASTLEVDPVEGLAGQRRHFFEYPAFDRELDRAMS